MHTHQICLSFKIKKKKTNTPLIVCQSVISIEYSQWLSFWMTTTKKGIRRYLDQKMRHLERGKKAAYISYMVMIHPVLVPVPV